MKSNVFKTEISYIKDSEYQKNAEVLVDLLPDYFFEVGASSTGKYHPSFAQGDGGLVRHTKAAVRIAHELLESMIGNVFTAKEKDLMILVLMLHDGLKHGVPKEQYVRFDHPILAANFIKENQSKTTFTDSEINFMMDTVSSHMGPFNTTPYSKVVLPVPQNKYQKFVHMCDLLASKKFLDIKFDGNEIIG
ncbi:MAG: HD domain-containing protein [Bacilli bacterium]|nr:HD domain-containing protein [Bacilli bacterium]